MTIDREWPAHAFDRFLESAVSKLSPMGFDYFKYRQQILEKWRELVGYFHNRDSAEIALESAILQELEQVFGSLYVRKCDKDSSIARPDKFGG